MPLQNECMPAFFYTVVASVSKVTRRVHPLPVYIKSICDFRIVPEMEQRVITEGIILGSGSEKIDTGNRERNRRMQMWKKKIWGSRRRQGVVEEREK
jgi:hypothetical protein